MKLIDYHNGALATCKDLGGPIGDLGHSQIGMTSEYLELQLAETQGHIKEELGDLSYYIPVGCRALGITLDDLMRKHLGRLGFTFEGHEITAAQVQACVPPELLDGRSFHVQTHAVRSLGRFVNATKRAAIYKKKTIDDLRPEFEAGLGGMLIFVAAVAERQGLTLAAVMRGNQDKLLTGENALVGAGLTTRGHDRRVCAARCR